MGPYAPAMSGSRLARVSASENPSEDCLRRSRRSSRSPRPDLGANIRPTPAPTRSPTPNAVRAGNNHAPVDRLVSEPTTSNNRSVSKLVTSFRVIDGLLFALARRFERNHAPHICQTDAKLDDILSSRVDLTGLRPRLRPSSTENLHTRRTIVGHMNHSLRNRKDRAGGHRCQIGLASVCR